MRNVLVKWLEENAQRQASGYLITASSIDVLEDLIMERIKSDNEVINSEVEPLVGSDLEMARTLQELATGALHGEFQCFVFAALRRNGGLLHAWNGISSRIERLGLVAALNMQIASV